MPPLPTDPDASQPLLQMRGIRKAFAGVEVLRGVDLTLYAGEVLALLGENGAGKSTLMKILSGDYDHDAGDIFRDGSPTHFRSPRDAQAAGIRIIHQELSSAPDLSVAENILLGDLPRRAATPPGSLFVDWPEAFRRAEAILTLLQAEIDPRESMGSLPVGKQQLVEIARALSYPNTRILVMDEPTAALTAREVDVLFQTIAALQERGVGIIYISHRLDEIKTVAQRVMVLRDGAVAGNAPLSSVSRADIVRMMVGREVEHLYPPDRVNPAKSF